MLICHLGIICQILTINCLWTSTSPTELSRRRKVNLKAVALRQLQMMLQNIFFFPIAGLMVKASHGSCCSVISRIGILKYCQFTNIPLCGLLTHKHRRCYIAKEGTGKLITEFGIKYNNSRPNICPSSRYRLDKKQNNYFFGVHSTALPLRHPKNDKAGTQQMDFFFKSGVNFLSSASSLFDLLTSFRIYPPEGFGELWISYVSIATIFKAVEQRKVRSCRHVTT
jgi:hypothetical protein